MASSLNIIYVLTARSEDAIVWASKCSSLNIILISFSLFLYYLIES